MKTKGRLIAAGMDPMTSTPEELTARIRIELAKWGKVIKASCIQFGS